MNASRRPRLHIPLALGFLLVAAPGATAQVILRTFAALWPTLNRAGPLGSLQDMDGDGLQDIILGDSGAAFRLVKIHSSASGDQLHLITDADSIFGHGLEVISDVTGDDVGDFLVSSYGFEGHLFSGATLEEVWTGPYFDSATTIGDIDGDGLTDFVIAGYGLNRHNGWARLYHGGSFSLAYLLPNPTLNSVRYGNSVVALGDVDGDGLGDFAVGAPGESRSDSVCVPGEVYVHSGVDGHILYRLEGEGVGSAFGAELASPGDLTGDGIADLVVGALACCQPVFCEQPGPGRISFFDGRTGELLGHVLPDSLGAHDRAAGLGAQLQSAGDLDGNGWGDVLTNVSAALDGTLPSGQPRFTGSLLALDGNSRTPIYRLWNPHWESCPSFPTALAPAGDLDGDDFPDWFASTSCSRRVHVVAGRPIGVRSLGNPCGPSTSGHLRIGATGVPYVGRDYAIHLTGAEDGARAQLLLGDLAPGRLLAPSGRCAPRVRAVETRDVLTKDVRPGVAVATTVVSIPNDQSLIGMVFHAQWWLRDAAGARTSRVLAIEIQPGNPLRGW